MKQIAVLLLVLLCLDLAAENLYVTPSGAGATNGSDWSNAFAGFGDVQWGSAVGQVGPGDTLYVAGGTYTSGLTPGVKGSVGNPITIKRATAALHGTDTGWQSSFNSLALLTTGNINLYEKSHITIDGSVEWGIKKTFSSGHQVTIGGGRNITFKYMEIIGPGYRSCKSGRGITINSNNPRVDHLTISHCKIHEYAGAAIRLSTHNYLTVENCIIYNVASGSGCSMHYEHIALFGDIDNIIIRNNIFYQQYETGKLGPGWAMSFAGPNGIIQIYNNVFFNMYQPVYGNSDGFGPRFQYLDIHNNTFVGYRSPIILSGGGTIHSYNNIFCNPPGMYTLSHTRGAPTNGTNNCYCYDSRYSYPATIIPPGQEPFVDIKGLDFRLKPGSIPIDKGKDMGSTYAYDIDGTSRPQGNAWDVGAYEYSSTNIEHRTPAYNLREQGGGVQYRIPNTVYRMNGLLIVNLAGRVIKNADKAYSGIYLIIPDDYSRFQKTILVK
jgi:hypothetical protein